MTPQHFSTKRPTLPYDPSLGRWLSQDPIEFAGGDNFYVYVLNGPFNTVDALGLKATLRCEVIQQAPHSGPVGLRHCYFDVECPGKFHFILEMWGPTEEAPTVGRPMSPRPDPDRDSRASAHPICPPWGGGGAGTGRGSGCGSSSPDCEFERNLVKSFLSASEHVPPYERRGPNSNSFASRVIRGAGGSALFPPTAPGAGWRPPGCRR